MSIIHRLVEYTRPHIRDKKIDAMSQEKKKRGRGLACIKDSAAASTKKFEDCFKTTKMITIACNSNSNKTKIKNKNSQKLKHRNLKKIKFMDVSADKLARLQTR